MKTIILLIFSLFLLTDSIYGQIKKFNYTDSEIKRKFSLSDSLSNPQYGLNFNINRHLDFPSLKESGNFILNHEGLFQYYPKVKRYPLSETAEALRYLEEGHARGKVVITV
jgi:NADPH:quinone reductase-like Zn-dependent oxidoreductase